MRRKYRGDAPLSIAANLPHACNAKRRDHACGRIDLATWGEFHGYACKQNGVAGAVVDGATRDGPEIRSSGFPTFVRGLSPVSSKWDLKTASINEPVMLGRVEVNPGDIIFADETAVVVIPESKKAVVLAKANEIRKYEDANRGKVS